MKNPTWAVLIASALLCGCATHEARIEHRATGLYPATRQSVKYIRDLFPPYGGGFLSAPEEGCISCIAAPVFLLDFPASLLIDTVYLPADIMNRWPK